jgi:hypothetical protein
MTSGLGRGLDKCIRDVEEKFGLEEQRPEERKQLSPADIEIYQDYIDRMMATAIVDGQAQDGPMIIIDLDLIRECRWWLAERGVTFSDDIAEIVRSSIAYHAGKDIEQYLKRIWHTGGPSCEESLMLGNYADPTGKGVWTKAYLEAFIRIRGGEPLPLGEHRDIFERSMKYWDLSAGP